MVKGDIAPGTPAEDLRFLAGVDLLRRTGTRDFQIRYQDDMEPIIWIVVARWQMEGGRPVEAGGQTVHKTAAGLTPRAAVLRLCEDVVDGGRCEHCGRVTAFMPHPSDPDIMAPLCYYRWDEDSASFRRSCE